MRPAINDPGFITFRATRLDGVKQVPGPMPSSTGEAKRSWSEEVARSPTRKSSALFWLTGADRAYIDCLPARPGCTILLATAAVAEGVNLQFCSLAANYDLP